MEQFDPTTPPAVTAWIVDSLVLDWAHSMIRIVLHDSIGNTLKVRYDGDKAIQLMSALNTANLSTNSLHKRILNQLSNDGYLPVGSVSGTPA